MENLFKSNKLIQFPKEKYCLTGSGGLECDIGGFKRVIRPERSNLGAGFVEAQLMLSLNLSLAQLDIAKVEDLGKDWPKYVPCRPKYPRIKSGDKDEEDDTDEDN